jgi:hypothetical protein
VAPPPACGRNPRPAPLVLPSCCAYHHHEALDYITAAITNDAIASVRAWVRDGNTPYEAAEKAEAFYRHRLSSAVELGIAIGTFLQAAEA